MILKNKSYKILTVGFLVLVVTLYPLQAQAVFPLIPIIAGIVLTGTAAYNFLPGADDAIIWLFDTLVNGVLAQLIILFGGLVNTFIPLQNWPLKIEAIKTVWTLLRDFSNLFFILLMIITAFATIFNYPAGYRYNKLLPFIIIAALLINFSLVIFHAVVDFLWYPANLFITAIGPAEQIGTKLAESFQINRLVELEFQGGGEQDIKSAGFIFTFMKGILFLLTALALGWIALTLLIRIPILMGLAIFSPLAWISLAFPPLRELGWAKWWKNVFYWGIIPVFYLAVIYLLLFMNDQMRGFLNQQVRFEGDIAAFWPLEWGDTILMLLNLGLLIGGILVAQSFAKTSGVIGSKIVGYGWLGTVGGLGTAAGLGLWRGTGVPGAFRKTGEQISEKGLWGIGGKERREAWESKLARGFGRAAGVTPSFAAERDLLAKTEKASKDIEDKFKMVATKPDEDKIIADLKNKIAKEAKDPETIAAITALAKRGQMDKDLFDNAAKQFEKTPLVMSKIFSEWKEGKFGGIAAPDLLTILKDSRVSLDAKRTGYNFIASEDGKKVAEGMKKEDFKLMYEILGGRMTKSGREAKKFIGEINPTIVAQYNLDNPAKEFDDPAKYPKDLEDAVLKLIEKTDSKNFTKFNKDEWNKPEFKTAVGEVLENKARRDVDSARKYVQETVKWLVRESKDDELKIFKDAAEMSGLL